MYQKQISELIGEISKLAVEVTLSGKAIVFSSIRAHVRWLEFRICDKDNDEKVLYKKDFIYFGNSTGEFTKEDQLKCITQLNEIKSELNRYIRESAFNSTWVKFQDNIEKEIVNCIKQGTKYEAETLFFDVEIDTETTPLTLSDMYETLKLTNGEATAKYFRSEMLENIEWLDNTIQSGGEEFVYQEDAV